MKKIFSFVTSSLMLLFVAQQALAECTLNGEIIPCDQMPKWPLALMLVFFVFMMVLLAFWVWMIVDVARNEKENTVVWVLIVVLAQVLGALIYYFVRKRNRKKLEEKNDIPQQSTSPETKDK